MGPVTFAGVRRPRLVRADRFDNLRRIEAMDPVADHRAIYEITTTLEFPWDITQALGLALFRTYAVPSIGRVLYRTGEFTERVQKRYDDTGLILDLIGEHGFTDGDGLTALRRMNRMHAAYGISNDDLRYVLCTFVVTPIRWLDDYGWRPMSEHERIASAGYYRELGRHMGIRDIPAGHREFAEVMDAYEAEHFAFDPGGRAVADSTLALLGTFPPFGHLPARLVARSSKALLDRPLLDAFHYRAPTHVEVVATRLAMQARARVVRSMKPRTTAMRFRDMPQVRSYPGGFTAAALGTFPTTETAASAE